MTCRLLNTQTFMSCLLNKKHHKVSWGWPHVPCASIKQKTSCKLWWPVRMDPKRSWVSDNHIRDYEKTKKWVSLYILSGLNYIVFTLNVHCIYCVHIVLLLRRDTGEVRDRFGGVGRFKGGLRYKGYVNSKITYYIIV